MIFLLYSAQSELTPAMACQLHVNKMKAMQGDILEIGRNNFLALASLLSVIYDPEKNNIPLKMDRSQIYVLENYDRLSEVEKFFSIFCFDRDSQDILEEYGLISLDVPEWIGKSDIVKDGFKEIAVLFSMIANGIKYYSPSYSEVKKPYLSKYAPLSIQHFETLVKNCLKASTLNEKDKFPVIKDEGELWKQGLYFDAYLWGGRFTAVYEKDDAREVSLKQEWLMKTQSMTREERENELTGVVEAMRREGYDSFLTLASFVRILKIQADAAIKKANDAGLEPIELSLRVDFKQKVFYVAEEYDPKNPFSSIFILDAKLMYAQKKYGVVPLFTAAKYQSEWVLTSENVNWFAQLMLLMANGIKKRDPNYIPDAVDELRHMLIKIYDGNFNEALPTKEVEIEGDEEDEEEQEREDQIFDIDKFKEELLK